jgi:hypothetical protein
VVTLKTKLAISFLLARCPFLLARTNALRLLGEKKDIWSGKAQRYLRKKLFVSYPRTLGTVVAIALERLLCAVRSEQIEA